MVHAHRANPHQRRRHLGEASRQAETPHRGVLHPEVHGLEKRLAVGVALFERSLLAIQALHRAPYGREPPCGRIARQETSQKNMTIAAIGRDVFGLHWIVRVELVDIGVRSGLGVREGHIS